MYVLTLGVAATVALGGAWLLARGSKTALGTLDPVATPITVAVQDATINYRADVVLTGTYAAPHDVLAGGAAGIVTSVAISPGTTIAAGDVVYAVNGQNVRAYASSTVLYRSLAAGDGGDDVVAVQQFLGQLMPDLHVKVSGTCDRSTEQAVKEYQKRQGYVVSGVFDPAYVVRIPADHYIVGSTSLAPGAPAPAVGQTLASEAPRVDSAKLQLSDSRPRPAGAYVFVSEGTEIDVSHNAAGDWIVDDLSGAQKILAAQAQAQAAGASAPSATGQLRLKVPKAGMAVPATALVYGRTQQSVCVLVRRNDSWVADPVSVIEASSDGAAIVAPGLPADTQVMLNANEVKDAPRCASS
jgi:peptidoglycan hydrolase-like protein with peptidoglycan-binding domain